MQDVRYQCRGVYKAPNARRCRTSKGILGSVPRATKRPKLGKRVYLAIKFGAPVPFDYFRWRIAFDTGWNLEYINGLSMGDVQEYLQIKDAMAKAGIR